MLIRIIIIIVIVTSALAGGVKNVKKITKKIIQPQHQRSVNQIPKKRI